jgi:peptide/nickel transport system ATP-binding protein
MSGAFERSAFLHLSPQGRGEGARSPAGDVAMTAQPLLDVNDLTVEFATRRGIVKAVQHVNISVAKGETLGIVGESGSGKSVTSYAVMRILDRAGKIAEGSVMFSGIDVKAATENQMRDLRGREISMIFQNPRAALNPIRKVGDQIEDVLRQHVQSAASDRGVPANAITPIRSNCRAACASAW